MALTRRAIVCESCGGSVSLYDEFCPYCGVYLEPLEGMRHRLPSAKTSSYAAEDAVLIKPFVELYVDFGYILPSKLDVLSDILITLRGHQYVYREYIIDLMSLVSHHRSVCLEHDKDCRETHLEILKRLEAVYNSLTL